MSSITVFIHTTHEQGDQSHLYVCAYVSCMSTAVNGVI